MDRKDRAKDIIFTEKLWSILNLKIYIYKVIQMELYFTVNSTTTLSSIMKKDSVSHNSTKRPQVCIA